MMKNHEKAKCFNLLKFEIWFQWSVSASSVFFESFRRFLNFRKLVNRKQRPTREKTETHVKYFLLIHLRQISELKVEVIPAGVLVRPKMRTSRINYVMRIGV